LKKFLRSVEESSEEVLKKLLKKFLEAGAKRTAVMMKEQQ